MKFDLEQVDLKTSKTKNGADFKAVNPKGYVPALQLDDGTSLTEGPAITQYIADKVPEKKLAPANGTMERYRLQETLNFISTEIHKGFGPLFAPLPDEVKNMAKDRLAKRFDYLEKELAGKQYLMGDTFTVADAYLFTVLRWTAFTGIDLTKWPTLKKFHDRVNERPAVKAALEAEKG